MGVFWWFWICLKKFEKTQLNYITYLILDRWGGGLINVFATRWHCVSKANSRCNIGQTLLLLLLLEHMMMSEDNSWRSHYLNFADIEWTSPQQVEKWPHGNIFGILSQVQFPLPVKVNWGLEGTSDIMLTPKLGVAFANTWSGSSEIKDCGWLAPSTCKFY